MKFTRKYSVLVPFKDILKGNIFKEPNRENIYVKIDNDNAICLADTLLLSYEYFSKGCEIIAENFEDFIEKLKKNEYKKKKFEYLLPEDIIFGSLFECDDRVCMKLNMDDLAVCIDDGRVIQLDEDGTYRIIKNYKMEIFE